MRKDKRTYLALALFAAMCLALLSGCGGEVNRATSADEPLEVAEGFYLYSGSDLGFSFLYPKGRAVGYTEEDGAYIYCGEEGEPPYVLVCRTEGSTDPEKYFDAFTELMLDTFDPVASSEIHTVSVGGKSLYMARYICGGQKLIIDRYLEPYGGYYIQYTSMSYEECSLDTELYYAIYTLRPSDGAYAGAYSEKMTSKRNADTGITMDIPDMLSANELYVGFFARSEDAVLLSVYLDEDDEGKPIYNRQDFIDRAAVSNTFVADQLGADRVSFSEGVEETIDGRSFYCYPMRMTVGDEEYGGELRIASAEDTGCYLVCTAVRDGCAGHDGILKILTQSAESFRIS